MTQMPQTPDPNHQTQQRHRANLYRTQLLFILGLAIIGAVGGLVIRQGIYTRLVPEVERSIKAIADRPLELGDVEGFSLTHVRFGKTYIPPTQSDSDRAVVKAIRVNFNPLEVLINRSLSFHIVLISPSVVIEQDPNGEWLNSEVNELEQGWIEFKLGSVRSQDADIALVPFSEDYSDDLLSKNNEESSGQSSFDAQSIPLKLEFPKTWPDIETHFVELNDVDGKITLRDENQRLVFDFRGKTASGLSGGIFNLKGEFVQQAEQWEAITLVKTLDLDVVPFLPFVPNLPSEIISGRISSNIQGSFRSNGDVNLQGTAHFQDVGARIPDLPSLIHSAEGRVRFRGQQLQLENTNFQIGDSDLTARGRIDLNDNLQQGYDVVIQGESLDIATLIKDAEVNLPFDIDGVVSSIINVSGPLHQPQIEGTVNQVNPIRVDQIELSSVGARFRLMPDVLELNAIQVVPSDGGLLAGSGELSLQDDQLLSFVFNLDDLPGDAIARRYFADTFPEGIEIGAIAAGVQIAGTVQQPRFIVQWTAPKGTFPSQGSLISVDNRLELRNTSLSIGDGTVRAEADLALGTQQWEASATLEQVSVDTFLPEQPGNIDGDITLVGNLRRLNPKEIKGQGLFRVVDTPILEEPLTASVQWDGTRLNINDLVAPNLQARGFVGVEFTTEGDPSITNLDLDLRAQDIDLEEVSSLLPTPETLSISGLANFDGRLLGTLEMPAIDGAVTLQDLVIDRLTFEPNLQGSVSFEMGEGGEISMTGQRDEITATIDDQYFPVDFSIRQDLIAMNGVTDGELLRVNVEQLPLEILNLQPAEEIGLGTIGGELSGILALDLNTVDFNDYSALSVMGDIAIVNPSLGHIEGDRFVGQVLHNNGIAVVNGGTLTIGASTYDVTGRVSPTSDTVFRGEITAQNGDVQDLLVAFKYFELADLLRFLDPPQYGTASDLDLIPIRISDTRLLRQLQRYAEIAELRRINQEKSAEAMFFPELRELVGSVSGTMDLTVSQQDGLTADFNLVGENWEWGEYDEPNRIIAQGSFSGDTLTLLPFRFESGEALINFAGQVGQAEDSQGQLRIENVAADLVADFVRLPLSVEGTLNATASLTGSVSNLQGRGEFFLENGSINKIPIQETNAVFSYADARLNLIGNMLIDENDPIRAVGSIPYKLPQGTVPPESDEISLDIQIENDGLAVLNILNDQVSWNGGEAAVSLQVGGTLRQTSNGIDLQPLAKGFAVIRDGSFSAQVLPDPLTSVNGRIDFTGDLIQVNDLRGLFSDGEFIAQGTLPLTTPLTVVENNEAEDDTINLSNTEVGNSDSESDITENSNAENRNNALTGSPLLVDLNDLAVNFKGLYSGGVNGQIIVGGTAFSPLIGGELTLSDGRVSLPNPTVREVASVVIDDDPFASLFSPPELNQLKLILGDRLLITSAPILNFVASGDLLVNGALDDFSTLRPDGTIQLRSGQVNIFTTQFNLIRGRNNVAIFRPNMGVDPFLDVRLATSVLEQTRSPIPPSPAFAQSEILDSSASDFAGLETIRVQASVQGPASQIFNELELSSSPSRSENELLVLIGGGFVDTQGRGNDGLAIASLAGTALFTSVQNVLSSAVDISDFRLFPAVITNDNRQEGSSDASPTSTLALAAELGLDITSNLSVSALQFLTVQEETQFSLRYQVNDQLRFRGLTNFSDENRAVLEFQTRF